MLGGGGGSAPRRTLASAGSALSTGPHLTLTYCLAPPLLRLTPCLLCVHTVHSLAQGEDVRHEAAGVAAGEAVAGVGPPAQCVYTASVPLPDQVQVSDK